MAKAPVKNGTLTILGAVKKGANIDCFDPDALTNNGDIYNQGRWNTISDGYTKLSYANQIYSFNNGNFVQNYISVLLTDRRSNITIDTPDMLAIVREGVSYRITPRSGFVYAQAAVNGKAYSGKSIGVVNGTVFPKDEPSPTVNFKPKKPCKTVIYDHIEASNVGVSATNLRKNQGLPQQSFFAPKTERGTISASFLCPLTGEIMQSPTFFTLDGTTYEEQAIRPWLTFYRSSPQNQQIRMEDNQSVDDVLFPNPAIKKRIDEFKNEQPVEGLKFN